MIVKMRGAARFFKNHCISKEECNVEKKRSFGSLTALKLPSVCLISGETALSSTKYLSI